MDKNKLIETVKAVQQGCEKSYNALYVEFAKTVYYIALKILDSKEDAEDITQEVFIKVHSDISTLENPETFPAWLKRVTSNKCTDFLRKQKVKVDSDLAELDGISEEFIEDNSLLIPDKYVDNAETSRLIIEVIDKLPLPQRICIYYYYFEQMTIAQIAEALSAPEGTVKNRLSLARDKIRKELEKLEDEEGIKLYGLPLLLTPVLKMAYDKFDMPESLLSSVWEGIQLKASAQGGGFLTVDVNPAAKTSNER